VVHVVSSVYRQANLRAAELAPQLYEKSEDQVKYIDLQKFIEPEAIQDINKLLPAFSYNKYLKIREEVLEAEQHLLRIIDFDTRNEQKVGFIMLMCYLQYLDCKLASVQGNPKPASSPTPSTTTSSTCRSPPRTTRPTPSTSKERESSSGPPSALPSSSAPRSPR